MTDPTAHEIEDDAARGQTFPIEFGHGVDGSGVDMLDEPWLCVKLLIGRTINPGKRGRPTHTVLRRRCVVQVIPRADGNYDRMTKKRALSDAKELEVKRKAKADEVAMAAAVVESANIRARFDEERQAYAKRYGVISIRS
ncbi:MAG: hypothetical protein NVS3B17_09750 [Vulcanimicrobiaceae bacterium]